jgi:hypothetical protein
MPNEERTGRKEKVVRELVDYWFNVVYLAAFFALFDWYRRLILAEYGIPYFHYGAAAVKALIIAKVILVGDALRLSRRFTGRPLIFPVTYRAVFFGLLVAAFNLLERTTSGLIHGKGLAGGFHDIVSQGGYVLLANSLVTFFAFVPFFAFKELERALGTGKVGQLFFHNNPGASNDGERHLS